MADVPAGITARLLPPEEWASKLAGLPLEASLPRLDPDYSAIVVVEDAAGQVIAHWAAMNVCHVEGVWQAEDHRGHAGVSRALLAEMTKYLLTHQVQEVLTQAVDPHVEAIVEKLGGRQLPGSTWVLDLRPFKAGG